VFKAKISYVQKINDDIKSNARELVFPNRISIIELEGIYLLEILRMYYYY